VTVAIGRDDWLRYIRSEYLDTYIAEGGAAIKVAIDMGGLDEDLAETIADHAADAGYLTTLVDSTMSKVHMIDQVFYSVADQVPWRESVERVVINLAKADGLSVADGDAPLFMRIAEASGLEPDFVKLELRRKIGQKIFKNRRLVKDFRIAVTQLANAAFAGGPEAETTFETLTNWLTGRNRAISAVKPYMIFSRISRTNARHFFESLLTWVSLAGWPGLVIVLDFRRVTVARNPRDGGAYYTKAAVLDAYEVLRQYIDAADRLVYCMIVVVADPEFLDEDPSGRGLGAYEALKFRIYDEVRDRTLANPMAALVRLRSTETAE
jgi:hypothetical protein